MDRYHDSTMGFAQNPNAPPRQSILAAQTAAAPGHTSTVLTSLHRLGETLNETEKTIASTLDRLFGGASEPAENGGLTQVRSGATGEIEGVISALTARAYDIQRMAAELQSRL